MPLDLWNSMPADIQDAIQKAADEYAKKQYEGIVADEQTVFDVLRDNGMTITELSDEDIDAWHASADAMEDYFEEYVGKDVYDEYMAAVEASKG